MKTLGIEISGSDIYWIGIEGEKKAGKLLFQNKNRVDFPASGQTDVENLLVLQTLVYDNITADTYDLVGIIRSSKGCNPLRAKCELIVELACKQATVVSQLVSPQTVSAALKRKIAKVTGSSFIVGFNGGSVLSPGYLEKAAACAWCVLE